jgi:hypothetical protein
VKSFSLGFALACLSALTTFTTYARAQEGPAGLGGSSGHVFAEFSAVNPGQGEGFLWGASAGGYLQGRVLGWVLRGTATPSGDLFHIYSAVVGPRIALRLPLLNPYIEAAGGVGHNSYYNSYGSVGSSWGPAWQVAAGVEHGLLPRVRWRIVEVAYGHIYAGSGVSPTVISTGLDLHVW